MNDLMIEPTDEEKMEQAMKLVAQQIEANRDLAKRLDENESRVALALLIQNTNHQFIALAARIDSLAKILLQPRPDANPIIQ